MAGSCVGSSELAGRRRAAAAFRAAVASRAASASSRKTTAPSSASPVTSSPSPSPSLSPAEDAPLPPPTATACRLRAFRLAFAPFGGARLDALGTALGAFGGGATFARQRCLLCGGGGRAAGGGGGGGAAEEAALGGGPSGSSDLSFLKAASACVLHSAVFRLGRAREGAQARSSGACRVGLQSVSKPAGYSLDGSELARQCRQWPHCVKPGPPPRASGSCRGVEAATPSGRPGARRRRWCSQAGGGPSRCCWLGGCAGCWLVGRRSSCSGRRVWVRATPAVGPSDTLCGCCRCRVVSRRHAKFERGGNTETTTKDRKIDKGTTELSPRTPLGHAPRLAVHTAATHRLTASTNVSQ